MHGALVITCGRAADGPYDIDKLTELGYELVDVPDAKFPLHAKARDVIGWRRPRSVRARHG